MNTSMRQGPAAPPAPASPQSAPLSIPWRSAPPGKTTPLLAALLALLAWAPARAQDDRFSDRLEEIREMDAAGAREEACRALLEEGPPPAVGAVCRSVLHLAAERPDSAQREAERFFAAGGYAATGGLLLVDELDRRGRTTFAWRLLRRVVEAAPEEPLVHARLGAMCLVRGDTTQAMACAEEVARRRGDFVEAMRRMARVFARWERIPEAVVLLYRLAPRAETAPEYAAIHRELGFAALGLGDTLQARVSLSEAAAWAPTREIADARRLLEVLRAAPADEARARARARAEQALGWELAPSPPALAALERMRMAGESCVARGGAAWRRPE